MCNWPRYYEAKSSNVKALKSKGQRSSLCGQKLSRKMHEQMTARLAEVIKLFVELYNVVQF